MVSFTRYRQEIYHPIDFLIIKSQFIYLTNNHEIHINANVKTILRYKDKKIAF